MRHADQSIPPREVPSRDWRALGWPALLVAASCGFSLGFACAMPLAAIGAIGAMTMRPHRAVLVVLACWLVNQVIGFSMLSYPLDGPTLAWGAILGGVAVACATVPGLLTRRLQPQPGIAALAVISLLCAFVVYEGGLFAAAATVMGGTENFTQAIVLRIAVINAAAFVGLGALALLLRVGMVAHRPSAARSAGLPLGGGLGDGDGTHVQSGAHEMPGGHRAQA